MSTERPLDTRRLLTIDLAAEARKLALAQIEDSWQIPAELARLFLGCGAGRVSVQLRRTSFRVEADGRPLDSGLRHHLSTLLDGPAAAARHRALVALESAGALALIALAALPHRRIRIQDDGTAVEACGIRYERGRALRFLEGACRFARARVTVDGRPIGRGFDDPLGEAVVEAPLAAHFAIPVRGEAARLWLLVHGVVAAHLTVPGVPCFEAAVEMSGRINPPWSAATLREAIAAELPALVEESLHLLLALGREIRGFGDADQRRLRQLLLKAARRHHRASELFQLPLFPALAGAPVECRWLSLLEVGSAPSGCGLALYPEQDPAAFAISAQPVLVLDAQERSQLGDLLGLRFAPPPPRPDASPVRRLLMELADWAKQRLRSLVPRKSQPIPDDRLSADERALLRALQHLAGAEVRLCEGRGPAWREGGRRRRWLLPRGRQAVAAGRRALARDPAWAYPVCLALLERVETLPEDARAAWLRRAAVPRS